MKLIHLFRSRFYDRLDTHMAELVSGASISFLMKVVAAGLGFGFNVLLARLLGADGAGLYFLALAVVTVGFTLGRFGLDNAILRFVSAHAAREEWRSVKGVYRKGLLISGAASILVTVALVVGSPWLVEALWRKPELVGPVRWMSLSVFPMAMVFLHGEALKGIRRVRDALVVNGVLLPLVALCGLLFLGPVFGVLGAVWSYTAGALIASLVGWRIWRRNTRNLRNVEEDFATADLLQSSLPLFWIAVMGILTHWASIFLLGIWGTTTDVGVYGVASQLAMLTSFILVSVNNVAAPKFSALFANKDMRGLERLARQSTKMMILLACPLVALFMVMPDTIMGIFGKEFTTGGGLLMILAAGQFVNVGTGSVGYLLMMTGHEKVMRNNVFAVGFLTLVLGLILIPIWGGVGAALTTAISLSMLNLSSFYLVGRVLNIWTIPIRVVHLKNLVSVKKRNGHG